MMWVIFGLAVLLISGFVGLYLKRFREVYTEMTGMMVGMTMGMLNGFVLGFAASAAAGDFFHATATVSLFWGNLFGILLGIGIGGYMGRAGGLMGLLDGAMGGMMGGSMGAMLMVMVEFPEWAAYWTAVLLSAIYVAGMFALVLLIERSAEGHGALHRLAPWFTRAVAAEVMEELDYIDTENAAARNHLGAPPLLDYYAFLGIGRNSAPGAIGNAYLAKLASSSGHDVERTEQAYAILTDPAKRQAYDRRLAADGAAAPAPAGKKATTAAALATSDPSAVTTNVQKRRPAYAAGNARQGSHRHAQASHNQGSARQEAPLRAIERPASHPGPLIGGGIVLLVLAALLGAWALGQSAGRGQPNAQPSGASGSPVARTDNGVELSADFVNKLHSQAVPASMGSDGTQTLDVVVNGDTMSYKPNVIKIKQGVPVRFKLSVEGRDPG